MRLISVRAPSAGDPVVGRTIVQQARTSDMYFGVAAIVSYCSQAFRAAVPA